MKGEELGLGPCLCPGGLSGAEATTENSWESNQKEQGPGEMAEAIPGAHTCSLPCLVQLCAGRAWKVVTWSPGFLKPEPMEYDTGKDRQW